MIYLLDNGEKYSDRDLAFVRSDYDPATVKTVLKAAPLTKNWFILGWAADFNWTDKNPEVNGFARYFLANHLLNTNVREISWPPELNETAKTLPKSLVAEVLEDEVNDMENALSATTLYPRTKRDVNPTNIAALKTLIQTLKE